jgi:hypothetical protein
MVGELLPDTEGAVAHLLGERAPMREACGLADEQVQSGGVALELLAMLMLPARTFVLVSALRIERLSDLAHVFCGWQKKSISCRSVCC